MDTLACLLPKRLMTPLLMTTRLLLLLFLLLPVCGGGRGPGMRDARWQKLFTTDVLVPGHNASWTGLSLSRCAGLCLEYPGCLVLAHSKAGDRRPARCWLYVTPVEYTTQGVPSPLTTVYTSISASRACPPTSTTGYKLEAGVCYQVFQSPKSWSDAQSLCKSRSQGRLFVADTPAKMNFLTKQSRDFWIGGTDDFAEGDWRWLSGRKVTDNWGAAPGNDVTKNCLVYSNGKVWEASCGNNNKFLCEYPV